MDGSRNGSSNVIDRLLRTGPQSRWQRWRTEIAWRKLFLIRKSTKSDNLDVVEFALCIYVRCTGCLLNLRQEAGVILLALTTTTRWQRRWQMMIVRMEVWNVYVWGYRNGTQTAWRRITGGGSCTAAVAIVATTTIRTAEVTDVPSTAAGQRTVVLANLISQREYLRMMMMRMIKVWCTIWAEQKIENIIFVYRTGKTCALP